MIDRNKILDKIRGLVSKTTANGCTEHEALAALTKARVMMDAYEVTDADLALAGESAAILVTTFRDPHSIRTNLAGAVARFCDCEWWQEPDRISFCGTNADAEFALWLLDTLGKFVDRHLSLHLHAARVPRGERRRIINGFVIGCCDRINERLNALVKPAASSNGRALVVAKGALIDAKLAEIGIKFRTLRRRRRSINMDSLMAGAAAGDRATFGRPLDYGTA